MNLNGNAEKPKKIIRAKIYGTFLSWACIGLGIFFAYSMIKEYFRGISLGRITSEKLPIFLIFIIVILLLFVGGGLLLMKKLKKIYLYDDGFVTGNETEKNEYRNLHYFFVPGSLPNTFIAIFYQSFDGSYKNIQGTIYPKDAFRLFQQDIVKLTYPIAMENIERGGTEEFSFLAPKKNVAVASIGGMKKVCQKVKKEMEKADKIKITKEYLAIADEIYKWNEYKISGNLGNIVVNGLKGEKIVRLPRLRVDRPNLLEALIDTFSKRN